MLRHRLIPSRGSRAWHVWGSMEAIDAARKHYAETGEPVLVCEAPEHGIVREVRLVGATSKVQRRR